MTELAYQTREQRESAATLGMWVFLATEVLFFGTLFLSYILYRAVYPEIVTRAARELNVHIGTVNTGVLLTSSYLVALAVRAVREGKDRQCARLLFGASGLGIAFLALKAYEYYDDLEKHLVPTTAIFDQGTDAPVMRLFYFIYYVMTGVHGLHVTIGVFALIVIGKRAWRGGCRGPGATSVEVVGLYWHFVDLIWIFLYPLLYLVGRVQ